MRVVLCMSYNNIVVNVILTLYIVSVHIVVMESHPVDPGSIQGSHRPISFTRINTEHARTTFFLVKLTINNHIIGLVHEDHIILVNEM